MDRLTEGGGTWPEQEIVSAWLKKYAISVLFSQQLELQESLTKLRQSLSQEAARDEALEEAARVCETDLRYFSGGFANGCRECAKAIRALKREPNAAAAALLAKLGQGWVLEPRELKLLIDYHDAKGCEAEAMGVDGSVRYHDKRRKHYESLLSPGASDE